MPFKKLTFFLLKNKSHFWPQFWVLGSYIQVEGGYSPNQNLVNSSLRSIVLGVAAHIFNGFMGNEDVPRPRAENIVLL